MEKIAQRRWEDEPVVWTAKSVARMKLGAYGHQVYALLATYTNDERDDQTAWPHQTTIAQQVGISTRQLQRVLDKLESLGLIAVEERAVNKGGKHGRGNLYRLVQVPNHTTPVSSQNGTTRHECHVNHTTPVSCLKERPIHPMNEQKVFNDIADVRKRTPRSRSRSAPPGEVVVMQKPSLRSERGCLYAYCDEIGVFGNERREFIQMFLREAERDGITPREVIARQRKLDADLMEWQATRDLVVN